MGRMKEKPRYNVVSLRVSDEEWESIRMIMRLSEKSISEVMRDAVHLLKSQSSYPYHVGEH